MTDASSTTASARVRRHLLAPVAGLLTCLWVCAVPALAEDTPPADEAEPTTDAPDLGFRAGQAVTVRDYARLSLGPPPSVRSRRSRADITAGTWPDGAVVFADVRSRGHLTVRHRWDPYGDPHTSLTYAPPADDAPARPTRATVYGVAPHEVDLATWQATQIGPATLMVPDAQSADQGDSVGKTFTLNGGRGLALWSPLGGEIVPKHVRAIVAQSGGSIQDHRAAWLDGWQAQRVRLTVPHTTAPEVAELWVIALTATGERPSAEQPATHVFTLAWTTPHGSAPADIDTLAPGRAVAATVQWVGLPPSDAPPQTPAVP